MPTSHPNTQPAETSWPRRVFSSSDGVSATESAAAALEAYIEQQKTERKQERFFCLFTVCALINTLISALTTWHTWLVLMLFTLILLIGVATWLEVPWVVRHLERWLERLSRSKADDETE